MIHTNLLIQKVSGRILRFSCVKIKETPERPLSYRKSIYFEDETIRDLIFKGYTIVFRLTKESIEIFGFVKFQKEPTD